MIKGSTLQQYIIAQSATSLLLFLFDHAFVGLLSSKKRLIKSTKLKSGDIN